MTDKFTRKPLLCQECGSKWMQEKHVRTMFLSPYKAGKGQPLYSGATNIWIYCADCNSLVWKEGMEKEEKKVETVGEKAV